MIGEPNDSEKNQTIKNGETINSLVKSIDEVFDFNRLTVDSAFVVGLPGCGKSMLAKHLVSKMPCDWRIRVIDSSSAWDTCSLKWKYECSPKDLALPCFPNISLVYDIGNLYVDQMIVQIQDLIRREWESNLRLYKDGKPRMQYLYVFEEAEDYLEPGILRSKKGREFKRLFCKGRNNRMRTLSLTQRPQLVDNSCWELGGQIIYGKFQRTDYIKNVLGDDAERTRDLEVGTWLYYCDGLVQQVNSKVFKGETLKVINGIMGREVKWRK